jgi:tRNA-dihydrouridine synthase A
MSATNLEPHSSPASPWRFCIAPMMQYTDRHFRVLARIMSAHARLYTEMVVCDALLHGDRDRFLRHAEFEAPVALQLGGCKPDELASAARLGRQAGFCEINFNVGCPSSRVKSGRFGASLMAEPELVADCVAAMQGAVDVPVTVKTRVGIDHRDSYDELVKFVQAITEAGCKAIIMHARKAWLEGMSPRENREIPPLRYDMVRRLKRDFPRVTVVMNGGIRSIEQADLHLDSVDGVMIGRAAYQTPYIIAAVDRALFASTTKQLDRIDVFRRYADYAETEIDSGTYLRHLAKPLHYLFQGQPGARQWRRHLSEHCAGSDAGIEALNAALHCVERAVTTKPTATLRATS